MMATMTTMTMVTRGVKGANEARGGKRRLSCYDRLYCFSRDSVLARSDVVLEEGIGRERFWWLDTLRVLGLFALITSTIVYVFNS